MKRKSRVALAQESLIICNRNVLVWGAGTSRRPGVYLEEYSDSPCGLQGEDNPESFGGGAESLCLQYVTFQLPFHSAALHMLQTLFMMSRSHFTFICRLY